MSCFDTNERRFSRLVFKLQFEFHYVLKETDSLEINDRQHNTINDNKLETGGKKDRINKYDLTIIINVKNQCIKLSLFTATGIKEALARRVLQQGVSF